MFFDFKTGIKNPNQFAYFNLLKIIGAIVIAFFFHFQDHFLLYLSIKKPFTGIFYFLSIYGHCFVEMFFIISGILFSYVYQPKIIQGLSFKAFIKNRALRLFPLAVLTTLTAYGFNILLHQNNIGFWGPNTAKNIFCDTFLLTKIVNTNPYLNGPAWYISVLMVCYVLGFLFTKFKSSSLFFFAVFIGICIPCFKLNYPFLNIDIARGLLSFFTGVSIKPLFEIISSFKQNEKIIFRIFIISSIAVSFTIYQKNSLYFSPASFITFFLFIPLFICLYELKWLNKLCETKTMKLLGDISFDIYLWNFPIYMFLQLFIIKGYIKLLSVWSFWYFVIALHLIVTLLSHRFIKTKRTSYFSKAAS